jgi:hypothetical protein
LENEFLLEFKCTGCGERKFEKIERPAGAIKFVPDTGGEHFGYKVGVGNFRCGVFKLEQGWEKFK